MVETQGFRHAASRGAKWIASAQLIKQIVQFTTVAILGVLLGPEAFGLIGMATVVIGFLDVFKNLGTAPALVQKDSLSEDLICSVFWVNAAIGILLAILVIAIAPGIAWFYEEPRLTAVVAVLALNFIVAGPAEVGRSLLQRDLRFDHVASIEIGSVLLGAVVGILLAVLGYGVWSLVIQSMASNMTRVTLTLLTLQRFFKPVVRLSELRAIWGFSANLTAFSVFNYVARNTDSLLIGKYLGAGPLGQYTLAYRLMLYPLQNLTGVIARVMYPILSRLQDDHARFRNVYTKCVSMIAVFSFPMMAGMCIVAGTFIRTFFGEEWSDAAVCLMVLAPIGMLQSIGSTSGVIYQAQGRTDWMLRWELLAGFVRITAFAVGLRWGVVGVAVAYAVATVMLSYPNLAIPFRLVRMRVSDLIAAVRKPFLCSMAMLPAVFVANALVPLGTQDAIRLAVMVSVGAIVYVLLAVKINSDQISELWSFVGGTSAA